VRERFLSLIRADFPSLEIGDARLLTNGWDHDVVIVNEAYVFRFPTEPSAQFDVEIAILKKLCGATTLAIPVVEFVGHSTQYIGYRMVRGTELTAAVYTRLSGAQRAQLACDFAQFLAEVHRAISVREAVSLGVPREDPRSYLDESRAVVNRITDAGVRAFVEDTLDEYEEMWRDSGIESFLYNDLHGDNVGFDVERGRLNGVYDFGDVAIGDLHREFGPLYRLDKGLLEATVAEYESMMGVSLSLRRIVMIQRLDRLADLATLIDDVGNPEIQRVFDELNDWRNEPDIYTSL
jgi:aminoglycoside 2''-phosphotransferase